MTGHNNFKKWNLFPGIACFTDKNMNACETENHSKSYIYFESLEFLLKCIMTIIPRLNKLLENKTLKTNVTTCKRKKKKKNGEHVNFWKY